MKIKPLHDRVIVKRLEVAEKTKAKILELAAPELGVAPEGLGIKQGRIFLKGDPAKGLTIGEVLKRGELTPLLMVPFPPLPNRTVPGGLGPPPFPPPSLIWWDKEHRCEWGRS